MADTTVCLSVAFFLFHSCFLGPSLVHCASLYSEKGELLHLLGKPSLIYPSPCHKLVQPQAHTHVYIQIHNCSQWIMGENLLWRLLGKVSLLLEKKTWKDKLPAFCCCSSHCSSHPAVMKETHPQMAEVEAEGIEFLIMLLNCWLTTLETKYFRTMGDNFSEVFKSVE